MNKIPFKSEYTKKIEMSFKCQTIGCDETYDFEESGSWDIQEDIECECGAKYHAFGDIEDGDCSVEQSKIMVKCCITGKFKEWIPPAPNQIDMFLNKTYGELKEIGQVS